jgi:hypothetical protein
MIESCNNKLKEMVAEATHAAAVAAGTACKTPYPDNHPFLLFDHYLFVLLAFLYLDVAPIEVKDKDKKKRRHRGDEDDDAETQALEYLTINDDAVIFVNDAKTMAIAKVIRYVLTPLPNGDVIIHTI